MKIAIITLLYPPRWMGGTEIASRDIAEALAKRDHDVHIITSFDDGLPHLSSESGFLVHRIKVPRIRFLEIIVFWLKLTKEIENIQPDILLIQSIPIGLGGYFIKRKLKIPYAVWGQGSDVYRPWPFKRIISRLTLKNAALVLALTQHMGKDMKRLGANDCDVVPNGTQLGKFTDGFRVNTRSTLNIRDNESVLLFVGGLKPIKGLKYLIQAMKDIIKACPNTKLVIAGNGSELENLKNLVYKLNIENNVCFLGTVAHDEVPKLMTASDIFVLPSLSEGFPLVIVEAMAAGLPIVASRVGGLPEIVNDKLNGFLVQSRNSAQITEKVIMLLQNVEMMHHISENNKTSVKKYSWDEIAERLERLLDLILA